MIGLLALLGACLLVLAIAVYSFREAKRERRETLRMREAAERDQAAREAKHTEQIGELLDRMSAMIGRPWALPPLPALPNFPRVQESDELEAIAEPGELLDDLVLP